MKTLPLVTAASSQVLALVLGLTASSAFAQGAGEQTEEVVVTGIRKAMEKSLDVKRNANQVVESLDLSDINSMPDVTIADALVRLPGINGARDRGNQSQASIRGLGPRMVFGTINGREVTSSEPGRSIRYEQYPSELISGVKVFKSQAADMIAGGIAGTIDLETVSPLNHTGPEFNLGAGLVSYDGGKDIPGFDPLGNRFSASMIKKVNDQFGFALGVTSQLQKNAYPSYQAWGFNTGSGQSNLPVGGGDLTGNGDFGYVPWGMQAEVKNIETQRNGVMGVLQFNPSDDLEIKYDALYSVFDLSEKQNQTWYQDIGNYDNGETGGYGDVVIENNYAVAASVNPWTGNIRHVIADYSQENSVFAQGVNVKYSGFDNWVIKADLSHSSAGRDNYWHALYLDEQGAPFAYDLRGKPSVTAPAGSSTASPESAQLAIDDTNEGSVLRDKNSSLALNFNRLIEVGDIASVDFGVRTAERDKDVVWTDYNISSSLGLQFSWANNGPYANFPEGFLSSYRVGAIATTPFLDAPTYYAAAQQLFGKTDFSSLAQVNVGKYWRVTEKNDEAFVKVNFEGDIGGYDYNANAGVRYVTMETESFAYGAHADSVANDNSYALPSASLNVFINDDNIVRLGIAQAISRPPLDELRAGQFISAVNAGAGGNAGNPTLDPFTSNQLDIAYEWYFAEESMLAAAIYYKNITNYVGYTSFDIPSANGQPTSIWAPANSDKKGTIQGFELTFQMPLVAGFGLYSNYAYAESDIKEFAPEGNPYSMAGLAKHTGTFDIWYSQNKFNGRLGWKYHSGYTTGFEWDGSQLRSLDAEGNLGLSLGYELTDNLSVRVEANNLTDQELRLSQNNYNADLRRYDVYGRTYTIDFNWKL
jgi:iron complex outermembrane recepter protein